MFNVDLVSLLEARGVEKVFGVPDSYLSEFIGEWNYLATNQLQASYDCSFVTVYAFHERLDPSY